MKLRALARDEIAYAREIFGGAIDYGAVRIARGSLLATFSATAVGNRINLQPVHFAGDTLNLSDAGMSVLIHELAHVWQYQHWGFRYIASSLAAQVRAWVMTGSRRGAYDWRAALDRPWPRWNAEQQAQCISDYHDAWRRVKTGTASAMDAETLAIARGVLGGNLLQADADAIRGAKDGIGKFGMRNIGKGFLQ
ncbi:MAG: DUF4157 domain-containing protein [Hyphomicrobiales bacterium]